MAYTLNEYEKVVRKGNDPLSLGFIMDLLRYSDLMKIFSFRPISGLRAKGTRWQTLPSAAFRQVNAGYTESTGKTENIEETLSILGGDIKIDRVFSKVKDTIEDPLTTQMKMKALLN